VEELNRYLWCRGTLARSSTELMHAATLSPRGGVLVLYADDFDRAHVVGALQHEHIQKLSGIVLVTRYPSVFRDLERDPDIGASLVILPSPALTWTVLDTIGACFRRATTAQT